MFSFSVLSKDTKACRQSSIPRIEFVLNVRHLGTMELRVMDTATLLTAIIIQESESILSQEDDGDEVAGGE